MKSLVHPLTPPPSVDNILPTNQEQLMLLPIESDQDTVLSLEHWLQNRCPNTDIKLLLRTYNRATIPIQEDLQLLRQLKTILEGLTDGNSERAVIQAMKDLENERAESDERCRNSVYKTFYSSYEFPPSLDGIWWTLLRSKSLLSINDTICQLLPHLFEEVNSKTPKGGIVPGERRTVSQQSQPIGTSSLPSKRAEKKFRVTKTKLQERTSFAQQVSPTKKSRLQAETGFGRLQRAGLRRSPQLCKK